MVSMFAFLRMSLAVRSQEVAFVGKCSLCLLGSGGERGGKSWCCWPERRGQGKEERGTPSAPWSPGKAWLQGENAQGILLEMKAEQNTRQPRVTSRPSLPGLWVLWGSPALGSPEEGRCGHTAWSVTHGKESSAVCFPP